MIWFRGMSARKYIIANIIIIIILIIIVIIIFKVFAKLVEVRAVVDSIFYFCRSSNSVCIIIYYWYTTAIKDYNCNKYSRERGKLWDTYTYLYLGHNLKNKVHTFTLFVVYIGMTNQWFINVNAFLRTESTRRILSN